MAPSGERVQSSLPYGYLPMHVLALVNQDDLVAAISQQHAEVRADAACADNRDLHGNPPGTSRQETEYRSQERVTVLGRE